MCFSCLKRFDSLNMKSMPFYCNVLYKVRRLMFCFISVITLITLSLLLFCFQSGCKHKTCLKEGHCYFNEDKQQFQFKCVLPWIGDSCEKKTGTVKFI